MRPNSCPCCGSTLLRHARRKGVYWFCPSCHQEMMPLVAGQLPTCPDPIGSRSGLRSSASRSRTLQSVNS